MSSHSLLQTDKRARCDLTPIVNWQLIICSLPIHTDKYTKDKDKDKDKERDKDKNKDNDGLFILRHKISKKKGRHIRKAVKTLGSKKGGGLLQS